MSEHDAWVHARLCRQHGKKPCDCEPFMKINEWVLSNDAGYVLGAVQQLQMDVPFYGVTACGRTGPMTSRVMCQTRVEQMLEGMA